MTTAALRVVRGLALLLLGSALGRADSPAGADEVLENDHVKIAVSPGKGGAVLSMIHKKAAKFECIARNGAGVAGVGAFFAPTVTVGTRTCEVADLPISREAPTEDGSGRTLRMKGSLDHLAPGLSVERMLRLAKDEGGFRLVDTYRNDGPGARDLTLKLGARALQRPEGWRLRTSSWFGDSKGWKHLTRRYRQPGEPRTILEAATPHLFWRLVGPYGVGFLYQVRAPQAPVRMVHTLPEEKGWENGYGSAAGLEWQTEALRLEAGKAISIQGSVLIDEGGREGNDPALLAASDRMVVTVDLPAAGKSGETLPAAATVVSARARSVKLTVFQSRREGGRTLDQKTLQEASLVLEPGLAKVLPFESTPSGKGTCSVEVVLRDENGRRLASSVAGSLIDGEGLEGEAGQIWKKHMRKIPERVYRGTWAQIGDQLAKEGRIRPKEPDARSAERLALYRKRFPLYAELLDGAAHTLKIGPERLASADSGESRPREACMTVLFEGPDGPLVAYSKERSAEDALGGLSYMKVLPDRGYPYQVYECASWQNGYGINSAGLCIAGVAITCDKETEDCARKTAEDWTAAGKIFAPLGQHLLLATCSNVEEALAFIENPEAPLHFTGNMLLADRSSQVARMESVGIYRQIHRYDGKEERFYVCGNYPHPREDGRFRPGPEWDWAANILLRERFIWMLAGARKGRVGLKDAFGIMSSHGSVGMCLHGFDNPAGFYSQTSFIGVPRTGELWMTHGQPCKVRYYRFTLDP
jgi:hypothetical protein